MSNFYFKLRSNDPRVSLNRENAVEALFKKSVFIYVNLYFKDILIRFKVLKLEDGWRP